MAQQIEVKVPDIGDFKDVAVIEVMVKPGETVAVDTSLIMVESDKASMEIPSSHAGVVMEVKVKVDIAAVPLAEERHNLPAQTASFVGRQDELAELEALLRDQRLVTLTGLGGVGKTRLALEVAARQTRAWPGGVWLVDLTPLSDSTLVAGTVATTLAVGERPDMSAHGALRAHIDGSELLLVLDNCEHVLTACSELAQALLGGCPNLRLLATSRMPLGTVGELEYRVDPLPIPGEAASVEEIEHAPSVQLFIDRGRAVRRDLVAAGHGLGTVARICRELDGLPLAIELAAARARALSLPEIAERLHDRFRFLRAWRRIADPRHQTLQATMDWSYELLSDDERELLRDLSVFAGGSTLEAVAFVCSDGDPEHALELLSRLLEASLVVAEEVSGVTRYRLLETVRHYAAEKLDETGSADDARRRHAEFFALLVEEAEPRLDSADVIVQLAVDEGNLRAALAFSAEGREPELMLRLAGSLVLFWDPRWQVERLAVGSRRRSNTAPVVLLDIERARFEASPGPMTPSATPPRLGGEWRRRLPSTASSATTRGSEVA